MKIIFLDIDGVLNSDLFYAKRWRKRKKWLPFIRLWNRIRTRLDIKPTQAEWRRYKVGEIDPEAIEAVNQANAPVIKLLEEINKKMMASKVGYSSKEAAALVGVSDKTILDILPRTKDRGFLESPS
jgi:hypothetical protein